MIRRGPLPSRGAGTTLVELVITIVIISVAIAGVVAAFSLIAGRSADPLNQTRTVELGQLYMDEILTKKYDHASPQGGVPKYSGGCDIQTESSETRGTFNDVDDYDGLTDSPPQSAEGQLTGYDGFSVTVAVTCAGAEVGLPNDQAKRIDLTITAPGNQSFVLSAYRANF